MNGAELIADERRRQIEQEGYDAAHDDAHNEHERRPEGDEGVPVWGALVRAAACYAMPFNGDREPPSGWPWGREAWKHSDPIRNLTKAGALIAAEIDRLQRVTLGQKGPGA